MAIGRICSRVTHVAHFPLQSSDDGDASMGDVVNLKRFRKRTEREQSAAKQADANRARFGRSQI